MEVSGGPNAEVDRASIAFDWLTGSFDYGERFEDALFSGALTAPTAWVTEAAFTLPLEIVRAYRSTGPSGEEHSAVADLDVVLAGMPEPYLTRLRTRLPRAELDHDLVLRASMAGDLGTNIVVTNELHRDEACGAPLPSPPADPPPRLRPPAARRSCALSVAGVAPRSSALALGAMLAVVCARRRWR